MAGLPSGKPREDDQYNPRWALQQRLQALKAKLELPRDKNFILLGQPTADKFRRRLEYCEEWLREATRDELKRLEITMTVKQAALNPRDVPPYVGM